MKPQKPGTYRYRPGMPKKRANVVRLDVQIPEQLAESLDRVRGLVPRATFVRSLLEERIKIASHEVRR